MSEDRPEPEDDDLYDDRHAFMEFENEYYWSPVDMYDHSGRTISTGGFSCPWDSGTAGIVFLSKKALLDEGLYGATKGMAEKELSKKAEDFLNEHVGLLDDYLTGNIHGFEIKCESRGEEDSCYGYYGDDGRIGAIEGASSSLESMLNAVVEEEKRHETAEKRLLRKAPEVTLSVYREAEDENKVCLIIAGELRDCFPTYEKALSASNSILINLYGE